MGWPAKNDKMGHSIFCDFRIKRYKKLQNKKLKVLRIYLTYWGFAKCLF